MKLKTHYPRPHSVASHISHVGAMTHSDAGHWIKADITSQLTLTTVPFLNIINKTFGKKDVYKIKAPLIQILKLIICLVLNELNMVEITEFQTQKI